MGSIQDYSKGRDNNYNLLRFLAAVLVMWSHCFPLLNSERGDWLTEKFNLSFGELAVDVFFVTSGFLITRSFVNGESNSQYLLNRLFRIYPALITSVLLCVFVLGPIFTNLDLKSYLYNFHNYKFLLKNTTLFFGLEWNLEGVFLDNYYPNVINGSLWTLPYELRLYLFICIIGNGVRYFTNKIITESKVRVGMMILMMLFFTVYIYKYLLEFRIGNSFRLYILFFIGAVYYLFQDKVKLKATVAIVMLTTFLLLKYFGIEKISHIVYLIILPYLVFYLAYIPKGFCRDFNKFGDYSYGLYIYAFPIQQVIVAIFAKLTEVELFTYSFMITLLIAVLSWHFVEKKAMNYRYKC